MSHRPASQNLKEAAPSLLAMGAIAAILLGTFMTIKTYRTDNQVSDLERHGVAVTYHISVCSDGGDNDGLTCQGEFQFRGSTFSEDIQGILNQPSNGTNVTALVDPLHPGSYVYIRSSVFGPNAAGRGSWLVGAILLGLLALGMASASYHLTIQRRRASPHPIALLGVPMTTLPADYGREGTLHLATSGMEVQVVERRRWHPSRWSLLTIGLACVAFGLIAVTETVLGPGQDTWSQQALIGAIFTGVIVAIGIFLIVWSFRAARRDRDRDARRHT